MGEILLMLIVVGTVGSVLADYIVRFIDDFEHKNNRHEQ